MEIIPRIYQKEAVKTASIGLKSRLKQALVVMATGLGKTLTAAFIAKELGAKRILFLVHNNLILEHAMDEFQRVFDKKIIMKTYNGVSKDGAMQANIVFASWQTMSKNLKGWTRNHFDLVVVDEAHHTEAKTYKPVVLYFKAPKLGITATPERGDYKDIRSVFGPEVIDVSIEEAIARGWLPRVEYHVITDDGLDEEALQEILVEIRESKKRFTMAEVNRRVFIKKHDVEVAKIIDRFKEKAIVFCSSIFHAERMAKALKRAQALHSAKGNGQVDTWGQNQAVLEDLRDGTIRQVCAVDALNEGVNVPHVGLVAFCRVTQAINIFRQQLGRGLRPGKDKLIVLDFVGNLQRTQMVLEMMERISELHKEYVPEDAEERKGYNQERFEVSGQGFRFTFSDKVISLIEVLKHCEREFYSTWQEASKAAITLGIKTAPQYVQRYIEDPQLPSRPDDIYVDFPNWYEFLGREKRRNPYSTWQEASASVQALGIKNIVDYINRLKEDLKLPRSPQGKYSDWPGWTVFWGGKKRGIYPRWKQAAKAIRALGIKSSSEYAKRYSEDPRLDSAPVKRYSDFPGWDSFFGKVAIYPTWQEASKAALALGILTGSDYRRLRKHNPRLPHTPRNVYDDCPSWEVFVGGEKIEYYSTWQEASRVAIALGPKNYKHYLELRKQDPKLPVALDQVYGDFPGWHVFMGGKKKEFYPTWKEASKAAIALGVKDSQHYKEIRKLDPKLPGAPNLMYDDFPSWDTFLSRGPKFYPTWQEASEAIKRLGIVRYCEYRPRYKEDPRLPSVPEGTYRKDFPGWDVFLGKK